MKKLKLIILLNIICIKIISQTTITLYPTKDAYLLMSLKPGDEYIANTNYGNLPRFFSGEWTSSGYRVNERSLVDFNFSLIPKGAIIISAKLSLYSYQPQADDGTRHVSYIIKQDLAYKNNESYLLRVTSPWEEKSVTYNTQPITTNVNRVLLPQSTAYTQDYLNIDVTALVQDIVNNPGQSYGMMLKLANEQKYCRMAFCSRKHSDPSRWPKLVITYEISNNISYKFENFNNITSKNYILSSTILYNNITEGTEYSEKIEYYDGLGRLVQTIKCKKSPTNKDIVETIEFDRFGQETKKYLPYTINSSVSGLYRDNWKTEQKNFYTTEYDSYDGPKAYSYTVYDNSPLNRVMKQGFPGSSWQPDTTNTTRNSSERVVSYTYLTNNTDEVYYWTISGNYPNITFIRKTYNANTLFKTTIYDENNNPTTEYTDLQGKVVLKVDAIGGKTYYIYDDFELLRCVIPPLASQTLAATNKTSFTINEEDFKELCYYYEYDHRQRLTKKKLPGTVGIYEMKYDNLDRLIEIKDPNGNRIYKTYDVFSRPIEIGIVGGEWLTKTKYDYYGNYKYDNRFSFKQVYSPSQGFVVDTNAKGKITVTLVKVLNPLGNMKTILTSVNYYDKYGRIIQTISENHLGGLDIVSTLYKYKNDNIIFKTKHQHWKNTYLEGAPDHTIEKIYTYDNGGRLLKEINIIDNNTPETISEITYDETSRIKTKLQGKIDKINYKYNIRDWLTSIGDGNTPGDPYTGNFYQSFNYGYNGNILELKWNYGDGNFYIYNFTYDKLNRLIKSTYLEYGNNIGLVQDKYNEQYSYDANGNILTVKRWGLLNDGTSLIGLIDDLTYKYYNNNRSNKLYAVGDNAIDVWGRGDFNENCSEGFNNKEYYYDNNGNLIFDENNYYKFFEITYNLLNLPKEVSSEYSSMQFTYSANGIKLSQITNYGYPRYDYIGPFIYKNNNLEYIITSEGRAIFNNNTLSYYEYHLKDHLGNVRVAYQKTSTGGIKKLQQNSYYPFGLLMGNRYQSDVPSKNRYLYNGKELISEYDIELNWYDYGARMYDPQVGKWHSIDPKTAQSFSWSPYCYVENNPLKYIDPNGERKWPVQDNYKGQSPRVDSWFGPRNISYGSKNHNGLDINFGSGNFDYGAPVLATHDGKVVDIKETNDGYGRYIILESPDGSFRTSYVHLKEVDVEIGQNIKEGDVIGKIGGSGKGKDLGYTSHLHYTIKVKNAKTGQFEKYNPTEGKGNSNENIVDPQTWITNNNQNMDMSFDLDNYMNKQFTAVQDNTRVDNSAFIKQIQNLPQGKYKVINGQIVPE